jgi:hypothetical protein
MAPTSASQSINGKASYVVIENIMTNFMLADRNRYK